MNISNLKAIINRSDLRDDQKETLIILELSKAENVIPTILRILDAERIEKEKLTKTLNLLLSKTHVGLENPELNKGGFMQKEIADFYKEGKIGHSFNMKSS